MIDYTFLVFVADLQVDLYNEYNNDEVDHEHHQ